MARFLGDNTGTPTGWIGHGGTDERAKENVAYATVHNVKMMCVSPTCGNGERFAI